MHKNLFYKFLPILIVTLLTFEFALAGSTPVNFSPMVDDTRLETVSTLPGSRIQLDGDSSLRKFSSKSTDLELRLTLEPHTGKLKDLLSTKIQELVLAIPISSLRSGNSTLDEHMRKALKAKKYPEIHASVKTYEIKSRNPDGTYQARASVEFNIAGVSKILPVEARVSVIGEHLRIEGQKELLMTDFKIDPPTLMLGVIRTANEIHIHFDLILGKKASQ